MRLHPYFEGVYGNSIEMDENQIHGELDSLTMHLLSLSQDLIDVKLELEERTKQGFIGLAQSRKLMGGPSSVSQLQFPSEETSGFIARYTTKRECQKSDQGTTNFNYFSLEDNNVEEVVCDLDSKLGIQRRRKANPDEDAKHSSTPKKDGNLSKDPLKWFGLLVPNALRQTQGSFVRALELSVECTNIQSQIESNMARKTCLLEQLRKRSKTNPVQ